MCRLMVFPSLHHDLLCWSRAGSDSSPQQHCQEMVARLGSRAARQASSISMSLAHAPSQERLAYNLQGMSIPDAFVYYQLCKG